MSGSFLVFTSKISKVNNIGLQFVPLSDNPDSYVLLRLNDGFVVDINTKGNNDRLYKLTWWYRHERENQQWTKTKTEDEDDSFHICHKKQYLVFKKVDSMYTCRTTFKLDEATKFLQIIDQDTCLGIKISSELAPALVTTEPIFSSSNYKSHFCIKSSVASNKYFNADYEDLQKFISNTYAEKHPPEIRTNIYISDYKALETSLMVDFECRLLLHPLFPIIGIKLHNVERNAVSIESVTCKMSKLTVTQEVLFQDQSRKAFFAIRATLKALYKENIHKGLPHSKIDKWLGCSYKVNVLSDAPLENSVPGLENCTNENIDMKEWIDQVSESGEHVGVIGYVLINPNIMYEMLYCLQGKMKANEWKELYAKNGMDCVNL
jgi:hypothetical protein